METPSLSGFESLLKVVILSTGEGLSLERPEPSVQAGEPVLGHPLDAVLAEIYGRYGHGLIGPLELYSPHRLEVLNQPLAHDDAEAWHLRIVRFAEYGDGDRCWVNLATVPELATGRGVQPVVLFQDEGISCALPFASNVNRAFELYARYCRAMRAVDHTPIDEVRPLTPMWLMQLGASFIELISQDAALVRLLERNAFEGLVLEQGAAAWIKRILGEAGALN